MTQKDEINKWVDEALNSVDNTSRAEVKPFLFTRLMARMQRKKESAWQTAGNFITRPAVVIAGLCLIISMNVAVVSFNSTAEENSMAADEQATDEFSTTVATLYDIENNEP